ncbi:MAG: protein kinase [Gemmatimonadaceae bacterium]
MTAPPTRPDASPAPGASGPASERWATIEALFQQALSHATDERRAFLDASCPDADVRAEVEALLAAHEGMGKLDELRDEVMVPLLAAREHAGDPATALPTHSRYRILERLGSGGMGVVYRARDERLQRDIALKFLPPQLGADESAKRRFLVEARAAAALEHPNICTIHEIGDTEDGRLYIAMACYDGETLDRHIARGPLAVAEALRVAGEIARGLGKAHERGIVHRDIKPANVMVTGDGLVKILDFGIAKLADASVTQTLGAVGTIAYMSPEQAFGETVDHRTDIWALGVVLYEMLTGVRPFQGPSQHAVLAAALSADPEPVTKLRGDTTAGVDAVIRRALAKTPVERFASAAELFEALAVCAAGVRAGAVAGAVVGAPAARRVVEVPDSEPRDSALTRGGERRQVALVACAIAGYDALVERLSPEESDRVLARIRDAAAEVATQHGGIVNHFSGDGLVMLFGVPTTHEDDAVRGVRAALALHARVADVAATLDARLSGGLRLRTGVHVGSVVAQHLRDGDRRFRITGAPADVAGRLAAAAGPDVVLVSPETRRLVAPFVYTTAVRAVALRADGAPVVPHRVLGASDVRSRLEGAARSTGLTPFVGRERELAALAEHLASAREGMGRFTVLVGEAGAGKSRLLHELRTAAAAAGTRVLVGRCDAYGGTTPFLPFVEAAHEALGVPGEGTALARHDAAVAGARAIDSSLEEFLPLYLALLAIPSEAHPVPEHLRGESFQAAMLDAVAALFTLGARSAPTLLLLEDWHWADEGSRAALRQLAEIVPAFPLLLVVTSRPDGAADWGSADHQTLLHLPPLDGAASAAIARAVLGAERVAPELVARLHERTGGTRSSSRRCARRCARRARSRCATARPRRRMRPAPCTCRRRCRASSARASTGLTRRRATRCAWPRWSAASSRAACSRMWRRWEAASPARWIGSRRRGSSSRWVWRPSRRTGSSTRSRRRWRTTACSSTSALRSTGPSAAPSSGGTPRGSTSTWSGSRTTSAVPRRGRRRRDMDWRPPTAPQISTSSPTRWALSSAWRSGFSGSPTTRRAATCTPTCSCARSGSVRCSGSAPASS